MPVKIVSSGEALHHDRLGRARSLAGGPAADKMISRTGLGSTAEQSQ